MWVFHLASCRFTKGTICKWHRRVFLDLRGDMSSSFLCTSYIWNPSGRIESAGCPHLASKWLHVLWLCLLNAVPDRLFMYNYAQLEQTKSHTRTAAGRRCQPSLMQISLFVGSKFRCLFGRQCRKCCYWVSWITNACFLSNYRLPFWSTTLSGAACMQYNPVGLWRVIFKTVSSLCLISWPRNTSRSISDWSFLWYHHLLQSSPY